jgi:hypothetical protein
VRKQIVKLEYWKNGMLRAEYWKNGKRFPIPLYCNSAISLFHYSTIPFLVVKHD